jgi:ribosomal protein L16 Arg81 hydroxylase
MKKIIKKFWKLSKEFDSLDIRKSFVNNLDADNSEVADFMLDTLEQQINKTINEELLYKMEDLQIEINKARTPQQLPSDDTPYAKDTIALISKMMTLADSLNKYGKWINTKADIPKDVKEMVDTSFKSMYDLLLQMSNDVAGFLEEQEDVDREGFMYG